LPGPAKSPNIEAFVIAREKKMPRPSTRPLDASDERSIVEPKTEESQDSQGRNMADAPSRPATSRTTHAFDLELEYEEDEYTDAPVPASFSRAGNSMLVIRALPIV
jgi:hypothetical protein